MKLIIVPTDFSDAAWNALLYAVQLAKTFNAELLIINSYKKPHAGAANIVSIEGILKEDSNRGLEEWLNRIQESNLNTGLIIKTKSLSGSPVEAISSQIKAYNQQLVVIGSIGETGIIEKLIGNNASDIVANVKCPVFVISPNAKFTLPRKIVLAADFNKVPEKINLELLQELCLLHPLDVLDIVNVAETDNQDAAKKIAFGSFLKDIRCTIQVITGSNITETLDKFVTQSKADLLVLIKKKKGLFERIFYESVTKKLTVQARVPLLILKAQMP